MLMNIRSQTQKGVAADHDRRQRSLLFTSSVRYLTNMTTGRDTAICFLAAIAICCAQVDAMNMTTNIECGMPVGSIHILLNAVASAVHKLTSLVVY